MFENKCYVQESEKKDLNTAILKTRADKNVTIIANDYIHAVDMIKKEKFHDSPLARHTPKIITHPVRGRYNTEVKFGPKALSVTIGHFISIGPKVLIN